ncbi:hypothetical protein LIER_28219 [Lithospermum erythrorhizon]|uniref:Integrase catalytic domain-containing protein n=1 Tax=Lithospermum erythrorhizon TaxID=34254 RepID=A0AAV3RKZ0_LITER
MEIRRPQHEELLALTLPITNDFLDWALALQADNFTKAFVDAKSSNQKTLVPAGLLQPLLIPDRIWEDVSLDFITGLPKSGGFTIILVVVNRVSKYVHFIGMAHPYTAKSVANSFYKDVVRLHGIPRSLLSDRDPVFLSAFWTEIFRLSQTTICMLRLSSTN